MTDKQERFVSAYLGPARFNATAAARLAGYKGDDDTLGVEGHRLLRNAKVQAAISERVNEYAMSAAEVLSELSEIARMSMADVLTVPPVGLAYFDFRKAEKNGKLGLIKKLSYTEHGPTVELMDKQGALVQLGKFHKLWVDKQETQLQGELTIKVEYEDADSNVEKA